MFDAIAEINQLKDLGLIKDYAVGGGAAVNYYIEPVATQDLDIFVYIETMEDFHLIYKYFADKNYEFDNVFICIYGIPVQILPSFINPLYEEAIQKAIKVRIETIDFPIKVFRVEHLIASLLISYRPNDKIKIVALLEKANWSLLYEIIERFSNEETPLDKRFKKILDNI